jgi:hypothetical protein
MPRIDLNYDGEFGTELQLVIPYAYYLFTQGLLGKTVSSLDTKSLYYFSKEHEERYKVRRFVGGDDPMKKNIPNKTEHIFWLKTSKWTPPPYKKKFANDHFVWEREPLVIFNKYNSEWYGQAYNYLSLPVLEKIIRRLKDKYQLIYCRPQEQDIVIDQNTILPFADFDLIACFPEVITMQKLHRDNPNLSFNTLQLMVLANCNKFISAKGGPSILASYFGGSNIIYAMGGRELMCGDYNHYSLYSAARIYPCRSYNELLRCISVIYTPKRMPIALPQTKILWFIQSLKYNIGVLIYQINFGFRRIIGFIRRLINA